MSSSNNNNMKLHLSSMYGKMVSKDMSLWDAMNEPLDEQEKELVSNAYHDTDSFHTVNTLDMLQGAPKGTSAYTLYEQSVHGWQKLPDSLLNITVQELQEIMDDVLSNGFEFRLQGSNILFREVHH